MDCVSIPAETPKSCLTPNPNPKRCLKSKSKSTTFSESFCSYRLFYASLLPYSTASLFPTTEILIHTSHLVVIVQDLMLFSSGAHTLYSSTLWFLSRLLFRFRSSRCLRATSSIRINSCTAISEKSMRMLNQPHSMNNSARLSTFLLIKQAHWPWTWWSSRSLWLERKCMEI